MNKGNARSKTVTLRLKDDVDNAFMEAALAENRPLSNLIETAAIAKIREQQFVDDAEMAEIHDDKELVQCNSTGVVQKSSPPLKGMDYNRKYFAQVSEIRYFVTEDCIGVLFCCDSKMSDLFQR